LRGQTVPVIVFPGEGHVTCYRCTYYCEGAKQLYKAEFCTPDDRLEENSHIYESHYSTLTGVEWTSESCFRYCEVVG